MTITLNPSLEALGYGETIGVFVGDSTITLQGEDSLELFIKLKKAFAHPVHRSDLTSLDPIIQQCIPELLKNGILVEHDQNNEIKVEIFGDGKITKVLARLLDTYAFPHKLKKSLLICIPDSKGLVTQQAALRRFKPEQDLLVGASRGTTLFVSPLIHDRDTNICKIFHKLLATESGIGNLYLADEFSQDLPDEQTKSAIDDATAEWMAVNLFAQIRNAVFSYDIAHIYRGSQTVREDIWMGVEEPGSINLSDSLEEKAEFLLKRLVGKGKLIGQFREQFIGDEEHQLYMVNAEFARPRAGFLVDKENHDCWGMGETRASARVSAFMEAIERYSSCAYSLEDHPLCPQDAIGKPILDRLTLSGYGTADNFPADIAPDQPRRWHYVTDMLDGSILAAPLELVRYPVGAEEAQYNVFDRITSSGIAAHLSLENAIKGACHELIERDAFMIAWLRKASPPLIDTGSLPVRVRNEISFLKKQGWQIRILDLTTDLAPVFCALLSRDASSYRYNIGASSNDDPEVACIKALREAQSTFHLPLKEPRPSAQVLETLQSPSDHMELYASGDYDDLLLDIFSSPITKSFSDVISFSGSVTKRLQGMGMKIYWADLNVKEVKSIAPTVEVVRVIVPELVPIHFGRDWARTGSSRIRSIPETLGWNPKAQDEAEYQRFPHPFP